MQTYPVIFIIFLITYLLRWCWHGKSKTYLLILPFHFFLWFLKQEYFEGVLPRNWFRYSSNIHFVTLLYILPWSNHSEINQKSIEFITKLETISNIFLPAPNNSLRMRYILQFFYNFLFLYKVNTKSCWRYWKEIVFERISNQTIFPYRVLQNIFDKSFFCMEW